MTNELVILIANIVDKILDKRLKKVPSTWSAKVVETSGTIAIGGTAQVYLNGDSTSTPISVKNKASQSLVANDECVLFSPSGSLNNIVVLYKK